MYSVEKDGLTLWAFLYGVNYVEFKTLNADYMLGYFVLSRAVDEGYLDISLEHPSAFTAYRLTPKGMEVAHG